MQNTTAHMWLPIKMYADWEHHIFRSENSIYSGMSFLLTELPFLMLFQVYHVENV